MDAALSIADAQIDPEDYYLDLDAGVEDFDFKLDVAYENGAQGDSAETEAELAPVVATEFEIGYEDDETVAKVAGDDYTGEVQDDGDEGTTAEYQDEIGYEDEDPGTAGAAPDTELEDSGAQSAGHSVDTHEEYGESDAVFDEHAQMLEASHHEISDQQSASELGDGMIPHDNFDNDHGERLSALSDIAGQSAHTTEAGSAQHSHLGPGATPASGLEEFEDTPAGLSSSSTSAETPDVTVQYNGGHYSLIGGPTDDPDSYFLSDTKELDGTLSNFLASIRAVISDEVAPEDELVVRINALELEFGERSNKKFLGRSFREIHRCFLALAQQASDGSQGLELELLKRRDCESRFIELLAEAGLTGGHPEEFAGSEQLQGNNDFLHEESSMDEYSEGYGSSGENAAAIGDDEPLQAPPGNESQSQEAPQLGDETMSEAFDANANLTEPGPSESALTEPAAESMFEEEYQEVQYEQYDDVESADEDVEFSGAPQGELAADPTLDEQELMIDTSEQPTTEQDAEPWDGEADALAEGHAVEHVNVGNDSTAVFEESHGKEPGFLYSMPDQTPERLHMPNGPAHAKPHDEDVIDYTDDEASPLPPPRNKRKSTASSPPASLKRRKLEVARWVKNSSTVGHSDDEEHMSPSRSGPAPAPECFDSESVSRGALHSTALLAGSRQVNEVHCSGSD